MPVFAHERALTELRTKAVQQCSINPSINRSSL